MKSEFKLTEEQITRAASWWADQVCAPVFSGLNEEERKDPMNSAYQMAEILAATSVKPIYQEQRDKFILALSDELRNPDFYVRGGLYVDYDPDRILARAAKVAGIPTSNFPWKTGMSFYEDGTVKVATGYGAMYKTL